MKQLLVVAITLIASYEIFAQSDEYGSSKEWSTVTKITPKTNVNSEKNLGSEFVKSNSDDTLFVNQLSNKEYFKKYKDNYEFKFMKLIDGSVLSVGDEVKFGKPVGGNRVAQTNVGLFSGNVNTTEAYSTMVLGRLGLSVMAGMQWLPSAGVVGMNQKILEIKKTRVILGTDKAFATVLNIEQAFKIGELENPKRPMNRTEAIAKLKESKDLLELGMIKSEEYEKIKTELTPIILQNK
jgi:hypothetical protein